MGAGAIITPEAVRLDFEVAGVPSRCLARLIDTIVQFVALYALLIVVALAGVVTSTGTVVVVTAIVTVFVVLFGYPVLCEVWLRGRTVGKVVLGLRVVTIEGGPVRFRHAAIRSMFQLLDFVVVPGGAVAVVSALLSSRSQRVGDLVAGTFVLRERQATADAGAVSFPPPWGYEGYVSALDPTALSREDYGRIRTFLLRAGALTAEARERLALRIAQPIAERLNHHPPATVTPQVFLYCLAAAYQQRFGGPVPVAGPQPPPPVPAGRVPAPPPPLPRPPHG